MPAWALAAAALALGAVATSAVAWNRPVPETYGRVMLENASRRAGVPTVAFDHWRHRSRFTCRLCHVDVGFAMGAGATGISAATNRDHFHCGACHDGKATYLGKPIFPACSGAKKLDDAPACRRCHNTPDPGKLEKEYEEFASKLPRDALGLVDWEKAEAERLVRPLDYLEGASVKRKPLEMSREVAIESKAGWMSDIIFSHKKHTVWNGCEVCHPDIFPRTNAGGNHYTMLQIANGEYCGACHDKVAFSLADCGRCHAKPVR